MEWTIGEGKKVKFWEDKWIRELPLIYRFPSCI